MSKHSIILRRDNGIEAFLSDQSVGTDALNAMQSIPGVENPEIVRESDKEVELTYDYVGDGTFWKTGEYLKKFGLVRADV